MAVYTHSKMTTNANKGHRIFGSDRSTKSSRNGGKGHVRFIDSLRTRYRAQGTAAATATIAGTDAIEDENGTVFSVIKTNGTTVTFTTNSSANYNQAPTKVSSYAWTFGTASATTAAKATQALHIALEAARVDGALDMTLTPASYTSESSFTLTQDVAGASGNAAIVAPAGVRVNGGSSAADGVFSGGTAKIKTAERLFEPGLNFGASKGTTYEGSTIGRTNTSVGTKDVIRDSAA